jgi:quaternary ammonium compound-resistance protein SugE
MGWVYLVIAGVLEIAFTTVLQLIRSNSAIWLQALFLVCVVASFHLLERATATIPVGTAYAVWTGIGAAGTALIGILYFGEAATPMRIFFLTMLISAVAGLKLVSSH